MKCAYCNHENDENSLYCINCGNKLQKDFFKCFNCGTEQDENNQFCVNCGINLNNYPQGNYVNPYHYQSSIQENQKNGPAVVSLVFGIITISLGSVFFWLIIFAQLVGIGLGIPGIILGARRTGGKKGIRITGMILSIVGLCLAVFWLFIYIIVISLGEDIFNSFEDEYYYAVTIFKSLL